MDAQVPLIGGQRPGYFHTVSLGLLIFLPATFFVIVIGFMTFLFQKVPALVWIVICLCLALSMMFMVLRQQREGPKYWFNLGLVCATAVIAGTVAGLWNYNKSMNKYWAYEGQRTYQNVAAAEPALQHLDAGKLVFIKNTMLDQSKSFAWMSGSAYCVAPVVAKGPSMGQHSVQYWAAGTDCCDKGSKFSCDDAADPNAHAGLVYLDDVLLPDYDLGKFRQAAAAALAAQTDLQGTSPEDALFVRWVKDVDAAQRDYWYYAASFVIIAVCFHTLFSVLVGFIIHFTSRRSIAKSKMEARSFGGMGSQAL